VDAGVPKMMDEVDFLAQVSIFSMMKRSDLERVSKLARRHSFRKADVVVREGERDGRLFVIMSAEVEVVIGLGGGNERAVRTLGPQSYFGEMALIDDLVRSARVVAKTDAELLSLDQWDFKEEIERYPGLAFEMLQMLRARAKITSHFRIPSSGHLWPRLNRKILETVRLFLWFCSIGATKSDLNPGANSVNLFLREPYVDVSEPLKRP
jgi:CRP/FNR family cyclic AMP-dependent transcriptional regulator